MFFKKIISSAIVGAMLLCTMSAPLNAGSEEFESPERYMIFDFKDYDDSGNSSYGSTGLYGAIIDEERPPIDEIPINESIIGLDESVIKVMIDPGHNAYENQSPVYSPYWESVMTWKLSNYLQTELQALGVHADLTKSTLEEKPSLQARGHYSKGYDFFISMHSNAASYSSMDKPIAICYQNLSWTTIDDTSREIGALLASKVAEVMQTNQKGEIFQRLSAEDRDGNGVWDDEWYGVLCGARYVRTPGILLEHSFHTNYRATLWLYNEDNLKKLAKEEAAVIYDYFSQKKAEQLATATTSESTETTTTTTAITSDTALIDTTETTTTEVQAPEISTLNDLLNKMTLDEKIYQMFIVAPESLMNSSTYVTTANDETKTALANRPVGGIVCFAQNIESWQQTYDMIHKYQEYAKETNNNIGLIFSVDEEGGSVARVGSKLKTYSSNTPQYYGSKLDYDAVYNLGDTIGKELHKLGFNLDLAPVADVNLCSGNELGSRIFSSDPQVVSKMATNFVKGLEGNNVSATLKHFPGLGAGNGNTHNTSVLINRTYDELLKAEFPAFSGAIQAGADFVMVGHQITSASGDNLPGDLSPTVINKWLKSDLGFKGIVITDSQSMGAIIEKYSAGEAAVLSIKAGADMISMPYSIDSALEGIKNAIASGEITEERINESVYKILAKKYSMGVIDIPTIQIPVTSETTLDTTDTTETTTTTTTTTAPPELIGDGKEPIESRKTGDLDGDNNVSTNDASIVLVYYARLLAGMEARFIWQDEYSDLEASIFKIADMDNDNKIDISDVSEILKVYANSLVGL